MSPDPYSAIRLDSLLRIKIRFKLGDSLHKIEVQPEGVGCSMEQIAGTSRRQRVWLAGAGTCVRLAADIGWRGGLARNEQDLLAFGFGLIGNFAMDPDQ
jgi:hypothetical protein